MLASPAVTPEELLRRAAEARERAYVPFSGFAVGAAVLAADGRVFAGCNVENRSFGLSLCAERTAVAAAIAAGAEEITAIAVVTDATPPAAPCGICRETLAEFCGANLPVYLANLDDERRRSTLGELLPDPFVLAPPRR